MLFKKKEDGGTLPDLPPAPTPRAQLPPIKPVRENSIPSLDKSTEMPVMKSRTRIPSSEFQPSMKPNLPSLPGLKKEPESEITGIPEIPQEEIIPAQVRLPEAFEETSEQPTPAGPIFVQIEKFKSAKESINKIQEKLSEIDELLKKTREIRDKEEQELSYWEKEIQDLKVRLGRVNESIFEKVK